MDDGVRRAGRLAYREATPEGDPVGDPVLLLHGFPESSYMWRHALRVVAEGGRRALAPDLLGYGDSKPDPPATWERHVEAVAEFTAELGLDRVILVVHDWGGLIGLRWACERHGVVSGLLISDSGFFPDGKWHGLASVLRTPGEGEQVVEALDAESFGGLIRSAGEFPDDVIAEYWKGLATPKGRTGALEMYRSGDFEKLAPHAGALAALDVPTLILWGESDAFSPVAGAYRFAEEIPHARLQVLPGAGHFIWGDEPERCAESLAGFLAGIADRGASADRRHADSGPAAE